MKKYVYLIPFLLLTGVSLSHAQETLSESSVCNSAAMVEEHYNRLEKLYLQQNEARQKLDEAKYLADLAEVSSAAAEFSRLADEIEHTKINYMSDKAACSQQSNSFTVQF